MNSGLGLREWQSNHGNHHALAGRSWNGVREVHGTVPCKAPRERPAFQAGARIGGWCGDQRSSTGLVALLGGWQVRPAERPNDRRPHARTSRDFLLGDPRTSRASDLGGKRQGWQRPSTGSADCRRTLDEILASVAFGNFATCEGHLARKR